MCAQYDPIFTAICSSATLVSDRNGFFQQILDNIRNVVDGNWLNNFQKLQTNEERILHCLHDAMIKDHVQQMNNNIQGIYRAKSALISQSKRLEAEDLYKKGMLEKALVTSTQSLIKAPKTDLDINVDNGRSLALAFWMRAKILHKLNKYSQCLEDIKASLKEKLLETFKVEAYWIMGDCYMNLNQTSHAIVTCNILQKLVSQCGENSKKEAEWLNRIKNKLNKPQKKPIDEKKLKLNIADKEPYFQPNTSIPNASKKLRITRTDSAGNHFIAAESISTGQTLIVEDPYVSCLSLGKYGTHCQHCLQRLDTAFPCPDCSAVAFCSSTCQVKAISSFHKYECQFLDLLIGSGMSILTFTALRIVSQQNIEYFIQIDCENDKSNSDYFGQVYNMVTHSEIRASEDFLQRTLMAIFLTAVLKKSGYFWNNKNVENMGDAEVFIAVFLLRNLEVLQFNAHEITESVKMKSTGCIKTQNIGIGLYKTASYFNHSCYPAVTRYFRGTQLVVKSVRPVADDEAVTDNYGPIFTKVKLQERKRSLASRYWFDCNCRACEENWSIINENEDDEFTLMCTSCKSPCRANTSTSSTICKICGMIIDCNKTLQIIQSIKDLLKESIDKLDKKSVHKIIECRDFLDTTLYYPHPIYTQVTDKLNQYWINNEPSISEL